MTSVIALAALWAGIYFSCSFIGWSFNFGEWHPVLRFLAVALAFRFLWYAVDNGFSEDEEAKP